ncbi:hypothetical protein RB195_014240 [Necator americanus]
MVPEKVSVTSTPTEAGLGRSENREMQEEVPPTSVGLSDIGLRTRKRVVDADSFTECMQNATKKKLPV